MTTIDSPTPERDSFKPPFSRTKEYIERAVALRTCSADESMTAMESLERDTVTGPGGFRLETPACRIPLRITPAAIEIPVRDSLIYQFSGDPSRIRLAPLPNGSMTAVESLERDTLTGPGGFRLETADSRTPLAIESPERDGLRPPFVGMIGGRSLFSLPNESMTAVESLERDTLRGMPSEFMERVFAIRDSPRESQTAEESLMRDSCRTPPPERLLGIGSASGDVRFVGDGAANSTRSASRTSGTESPARAQTPVKSILKFKSQTTSESPATSSESMTAAEDESPRPKISVEGILKTQTSENTSGSSASMAVAEDETTQETWSTIDLALP